MSILEYDVADSLARLEEHLDSIDEHKSFASVPHDIRDYLTQLSSEVATLSALVKDLPKELDDLKDEVKEWEGYCEEQETARDEKEQEAEFDNWLTWARSDSTVSYPYIN